MHKTLNNAFISCIWWLAYLAVLIGATIDYWGDRLGVLASVLEGDDDSANACRRSAAATANAVREHFENDYD